MGDFIENIIDPFEIFFDRDEERDRLQEENEKLKKEQEDRPGDKSDQELAKLRAFRSGTVFTNTLGEDITDAQTEGTRLI